MTRRRWILVPAAVAAVLAAGGVGIAQAVGGGDEPVTGADAEQARAAATRAAGGGTVLEVERDDDGRGGYEVEVRRPDGSTVEVHLDRAFEQVGIAAEDESGGPESESDDDAAADD